MPTMDIEDIKVGETYNVRMKCVDDTEEGFRSFAMETIPYVSRLFNKEDIRTCVFPLLPPRNAPKYAPCRKFRKGDKVRVVERNGRTSAAESIMPDLAGMILEVISNEDSDGDVCVDTPRGSRIIAFYFLELISPVEELEPYYVSTDIGFSICTICKRVGGRKLVHSAYYFVNRAGSSNAFLSINEAKAAAEAECARLNDEWRKEVEK